ncbi:MAG: HAMP domain-containing histidine kinase, partial [bacterium]|nr:HAMP domain-containing histidine kinase [bacterium]
ATFVSSVTHELKTPLTNIRMYAEMLEQGIAPTREREEGYFRVIGSESQRLSRLIENVLDFSKLEKRQRRLHVQKSDFEDVLREVRTIMQEKLRQEGFTLTVERGADIPEFHYDREVMVQILLNLIDNSIKFGKPSPIREITLRLFSGKRYITISVSDTGPGIPRSALKKIFDDFYRGEHEVSRATRGTGIGLALVKKFSAALGGAVKAENNSGPGCTITISLPKR